MNLVFIQEFKIVQGEINEVKIQVTKLKKLITGNGEQDGVMTKIALIEQKLENMESNKNSTYTVIGIVVSALIGLFALIIGLK